MAKDPTTAFNDPKMLEILKTINQLKAELENTSDEKQIAVIKKEIADAQMHYNILSERRGPG